MSLSDADRRWLRNMVRRVVEQVLESRDMGERGPLEHVGGYDGALAVGDEDGATRRRRIGFEAAGTGQEGAMVQT